MEGAWTCEGKGGGRARHRTRVTPVLSQLTLANNATKTRRSIYSTFYSSGANRYTKPPAAIAASTALPAFLQPQGTARVTHVKIILHAMRQRCSSGGCY